jgi:hypothetical protein
MAQGMDISAEPATDWRMAGLEKRCGPFG